MKKFVATLLIAGFISTLPSVGLANTSSVNLILSSSHSPLKTDTCYSSPVGFCTCYGWELQDGSGMSALDTIAAMQNYPIAIKPYPKGYQSACAFGCKRDRKGDPNCTPDCIQATGDFINQHCPNPPKKP